MERLLCEFTPYEIGKIIALYQADEQFQRCDTLMKRLTFFHPEQQSFLLECCNQNEAKTYFNVNKRMIFACYLISRSAYRDLQQAGDETVAMAINQLFEGKKAT